jgi:hypothetical protein
VIFLEAEVKNEDGKLAALATSTVLAFQLPVEEPVRA